MPDDGDGRFPISRREALILGAVGGVGAMGVATGLDDDGETGKLNAGRMALSQAYNVAGDLWIGPDSAKSDVSADSGRLYLATDTQVHYHGDSGSWVKQGVGSSSTPVPSVTTDQVDTVEQSSDPSSPASGDRRIYSKSDGVYEQASDGTVTGPFGTGAFPSGNVENAGDQSGADGGAQIQNAIDALPAEGGVVLVGPKGPDTFQPSGTTYSDVSNAWVVNSSPITLPDNTVIMLINAFVADGNENTKGYVFKADDITNGNSEIHIHGYGDAWIHGNATNMDDAGGANDSRGGIHAKNVTKSSFRGFKLGPTNGFGIDMEDAIDLWIDSIELNQDNNANNQDGFSGGGTQNVVVSNVIGDVGDDFMGIGAAGASQNCDGVIISNCHINNVGVGAFLKVNNTSSNACRMVKVDNCKIRNPARAAIVVGISGNTDDSSKLEQIHIHNFDIHGDGSTTMDGFQFDQACRDLHVDGFTLSDGTQLFISNGNDPKKCTFENIYAEVNTTSSKPAIDIQEFSQCNRSTFSNIVLDDSGSGDAIYINETQTNVTFENVHILGSGTGVNLDSAGVANNRHFSLRFDNVTFDSNVGTKRSISTQGAYFNGVEFHTLADAGKNALASSQTKQTTIIVINTSDNTMETFTLHGSGNTVTQHGIDTTNFTTTEDNDTTVNVYWDGTNSQYELNNEEGGSRDFEVHYAPVPV